MRRLWSVLVRWMSSATVIADETVDTVSVTVCRDHAKFLLSRSKCILQTALITVDLFEDSCCQIVETRPINEGNVDAFP